MERWHDYTHGSEQSRVFFLLKNSLEFELKSVRPDSQVRLIRLEATVRGQKFVFLNISLCSNKKRAIR